MRRLLIQFATALTLVIAPVVAFASPLVSPAWLSENLDDAKLVIIDLRNQIDRGSYETFLEGHIPGAIHSDYLKDGWRVDRDGVVGLLPEADQFQLLARRLGVSDGTHVVVVPAGVSSTDFGSAARAYWTFKVFGHNDVSILDGGFAAWRDYAPGNIETGAFVAPEPGNFVAVFNTEFYIGTPDVAAFATNPGQALLVDGRTDEQFYAGGKHPKAAKAGRIPSAVLMDQDKAYSSEDNRLKSRDELASIYSDLGDKTIVSYCNTGHWAATNWFVMSEILGQKKVKLYDGSMVEWTANSDLPLDTSGRSNLQKIKDIFSGLLG
ncbi:MAG: sulfurtransferase [Pseudomonadota bacterium]|nr:sulfurtransferase [Pseudomonadota bacterium]